MSKSKIFSQLGESATSKVRQAGESILSKGKALGGKINPVVAGSAVASGAAALAGAEGGSSSQSSRTSGAGNTVVPSGLSGTFPSLQSLEAPLNEAISGFLEENAPLMGALLKSTGLKPTELVDNVIRTFHARGLQPTRENVQNIVIDVVDQAQEWAEITKADELYQHDIDEDNPIIANHDVKYARARAAIATIEHASAHISGGLTSLIAIRAALALKPEVFDEAVQLSHGFHPGVYLSKIVENLAEDVRLR